METPNLPAIRALRPAWNKGHIVGQKRPLKPKHVWAIRVRLELAENHRDLALFNMAIDSKLRGCDLCRMQVVDVMASGQIKERASVLQSKTQKPVQFEISQGTGASVAKWMEDPLMVGSEYLWPGRFHERLHISTRQYARIVRDWVTSIGLGSRQEAQSALFYEFSIEAHVPPDHMLRAVDRFVDLGGIRQHLAPFYSTTGRPSVDPELMIRMLLIGYIMGIRSERRLCEEVHLNLAYRWFCRLDLTDPVPDHSTFSKNRHGRFRDSDLLRHLFETVVARCIAEGLASGQRFAADASIIQADANRQNSTPKADWQPDKIDPEEAPRAVREYLATLDYAAFGAASPVEPKFTSHSDPASQWTGARGGPAYFAYSTNYLIDTDNGVILDVEATRSIRQAEVGSVRTMIDRVSDSFGLKPERLIADTAYGTGEMLEWLDQQRGIAPHIPVFDKSARKDGTFERADFTYHAEQDIYTCPGGKELKQNRRAFTTAREQKADENGMIRYRASKAYCEVCELKTRCCPKAPARKVLRSIYEPSRDRAREIARTTEYAISCKLRKKVEMLFAHLKRILRLNRLRLRGPSGARDEFHLAATAQNLRKLAKLLPPSQIAW